MRTTSDSSATREACTGTRSRERRYYLSIKEPWVQEARRENESQLVSEDTILNRAELETEVHTSERLTLLLRQISPRRGGGDQRRWYVSPFEEKNRASHEGQKGEHRASHGGDGEDGDECNSKDGCNELLRW